MYIVPTLKCQISKRNYIIPLFSLKRTTLANTHILGELLVLVYYYFNISERIPSILIMIRKYRSIENVEPQPVFPSPPSPDTLIKKSGEI